MSPLHYGPSDINNPRYLPFAHVPESFWLTKVLLFDYDWIIREVAVENRVMPDHPEIHNSVEGLKETFTTLRRFEIRLGITSNLNQETVISELSRLKLADDFDCIRCLGDTKNPKPTTELHMAALETLGVRPARALAFETSEEGVMAAKTAGIFCVTMGKMPKGDYVLKSLLEKPILHVLEEIDRLNRSHQGLDLRKA